MTPIDQMFSGIITKVVDNSLVDKFLPNEKPKVGKKLRYMLYELYEGDINALKDLINRDLSRWKP